MYNTYVMSLEILHIHKDTELITKKILYHVFFPLSQLVR